MHVTDEPIICSEEDVQEAIVSTKKVKEFVMQKIRLQIENCNMEFTEKMVSKHNEVERQENINI